MLSSLMLSAGLPVGAAWGQLNVRQKRVILAFGSGKSGFTVKLARITLNVQWYLCDLQLLSAEPAAVMRCWLGGEQPCCLSRLPVPVVR